jgi:NAD(P)H dehydrogenase (quinone)
VLPPFVAWHVPYVTDEARKRYLADYRQYLAGIEALEPLEFPRLGQYDEKFRARVRE